MDMLSAVVDRHGIVTVGDGLPDGALGIELLALLIVVRDLHVGAAPHFSRVGLQIAEQHLEQRRLPGAIRSNETDTVATHHPHHEVGDDRPAVKRLRDALGLEHHLPTPLRRSRSAAGPSRSASAAPTVLHAWRGARGHALHFACAAP